MFIWWKFFKKKGLVALVFLVLALLSAVFSFRTHIVSRATAFTSGVTIVVQNLSLYETAPVVFTYALSQDDTVLFLEERAVDVVQEPVEAIPGTNQHALSLSHTFYISKEAVRGWYTFTVTARQPHETAGQEIARTDLFVAPSLLAFPFFRFGMFFSLLLSLLLFSLSLRDRFNARRYADSPDTAGTVS